MLKIENHCVQCSVGTGLHCLGSACPNRSVEVYYCDRCGEEIEGDLYYDEGEDLCEECLKDKFRKE